MKGAEELIPDAKARLVSRDEMNLAEFPLTVLSTRANPSLKTLEFSDSIKGKNGEVVERHWIITGADKFGLPTSSDDEVLLGLLKLTVDDGVRGRKVYFTRYELLKILRWTTEGRSYSRLQKALDRLSGVRIKATNAFYDNDSKTHSTKNFGLIDEYEINSGGDGDLRSSFFVWSDVLFKSFQVGFIKKLDLDFYLELESAVSKRLYRYLDKHFWYRSQIVINIFTLCHEKIGISRNYQYASSLRQQLDGALEELVQKGFLASHEYRGKGRETEVILTAAKGKRVLASGEKTSEASATRGEDSLPSRTVRLLVDRGLSERQVLNLIAGKSEAILKRVGEIVAYFDYLRSTGSSLIARSPEGFLYRAVERAETFVLPNRAGAQEQLPLTQRTAVEARSSRPKSEAKGESLEAPYLVYRLNELRKARHHIDDELLKKIYVEVETALAKLKAHLSPKRFEEAVEHAVDEKIAKLFQVPTFDEWVNKPAGRPA